MVNDRSAADLLVFPYFQRGTMTQWRAATIFQAVLEEGLDFSLAVGACGGSALCVVVSVSRFSLRP